MKLNSLLFYVLGFFIIFSKIVYGDPDNEAEKIEELRELSPRKYVDDNVFREASKRRSGATIQWAYAVEKLSKKEPVDGRSVPSGEGMAARSKVDHHASKRLILRRSDDRLRTYAIC